MSSAVSRSAPRFVESAPGVRIAYHAEPGAAPAVVFLPGFNSVMTGAKALHLEALCRRRGHAFARFDYRGHGESPGALAAGTIGGWRRDARAVIDALDARSAERLILVGASLGGWIMLLLARALGPRVRGLVGVAAAADFTDWITEGLSPAQRRELARTGVTQRPSRYGDGPYPLTRAMLEDGRRHRVLAGGLRLECPVCLLHGMADPDLPWRHAIAVAEALDAPSVRVVLVKDGDHRLSRPQDLELLEAVLAPMLPDPDPA